LSGFFIFRSGVDVRVKLPYHKGRVVYAGRLVLYVPRVFARVESHYDEDMSDWMAQFSGLADKIDIDSMTVVWPQH